MINLRRTINIGIGGTGIEVLRLLKRKYGGQNAPKWVGFLAIDTCEKDLKGLIESGNFDYTEVFHITCGSGDALATYETGSRRGKFAWMIDRNQGYLNSVDLHGANQVRTNGRFILERSLTTDSFAQALDALIGKVTGINNHHPEYVDALNADIDINIIFSLSGGTGSGGFLPLAYKVLEVVGANPKPNVTGYGFSHSFFRNIASNVNVKANAYGALLELDYCMQLGSDAKYRVFDFPVAGQRQAQYPFDAFMYIDTNTYKNADRGEQQLTRTRDDAVRTVAEAIVLASGQLGSESRSLMSNINALFSGASGNVNFDGFNKRAWASSVGTAELFCDDNADRTSLAERMAEKIIGVFLRGNRTDGMQPSEIVVDWVNNKLDINESGDEADHDAVINSILQKTEINSRIQPDDFRVGGDGTCTFDREDILAEMGREMTVNQRAKLDDCRARLIRLIRDELFPATQQSIGIIAMKQVLTTLSSKIAEMVATLGREIGDNDTTIRQCAADSDDAKKSLVEMNGKTFVFNRDEKLNEQKRQIGSRGCDIQRLRLENERRRLAIALLNNLRSSVDEYNNDLTTIAGRITESLAAIQRKVASLRSSLPDTSLKLIAYDLTTYASRPTTGENSDTFKLSNWDDFYVKALGAISVSEMAKIQDWSAKFVGYIFRREIGYGSDNVLVEHGEVDPNACLSQKGLPIIMLALGRRLDDEDRMRDRGDYAQAHSIVKRVVDSARPLMDIDNYGDPDAIKACSVKFVAMPECADKRLNDRVKEAFRQQLGPDVNFIPIRNANQIVVMHQRGVVSPYFIKGVSRGSRYSPDENSCQSGFIRMMNENAYSPFTDKGFEHAYRVLGHELNQYIGCRGNETMAMWVKSLLFDIVVRKEGDAGVYRISSNAPGATVDDDDLNLYIVLGETRKEAYEYFQALPNDVRSSIISDIKAREQDADCRQRLEGIRRAGAAVMQEYMKYARIDRNSAEYANPEIKAMVTGEELGVVRRL